MPNQSYQINYNHLGMFEDQLTTAPLKIPAWECRLINSAPFDFDLAICAILTHNWDDGITNTLLHQETSLLEHQHTRFWKQDDEQIQYLYIF